MYSILFFSHYVILALMKFSNSMKQNYRYIALSLKKGKNIFFSDLTISEL